MRPRCSARPGRGYAIGSDEVASGKVGKRSMVSIWRIGDVSEWYANAGQDQGGGGAERCRDEVDVDGVSGKVGEGGGWRAAEPSHRCHGGEGQVRALTGGAEPVTSPLRSLHGNFALPPVFSSRPARCSTPFFACHVARVFFCILSFILLSQAATNRHVARWDPVSSRGDTAPSLRDRGSS